jgi:hypothetical protein
MAQFIRTPINDIYDIIDNTTQISQVNYRDQYTIEINYDTQEREVVIRENNNQYFYLRSPDIPNLTIIQVLEELGYADNQMVVTWVDGDNQNNQNNHNNILNSIVEHAPLNQISLFALQ